MSMMAEPRMTVNPLRDARVDLDVGSSARAFHRRLPGYAVSQLIDAPDLARALGVKTVLLKAETSRYGLPAFKILGASWAAYRALDQLIGGFGDWTTLEDLTSQVAPHLPLKFVAATDGNHGRAVARMAKLFGIDCTIYVPADMVQARIDAIAGEGAEVVVVDGSYDEAVARSAEDASERCLVISDTSWPGYTDVPGWVIDGYGTILEEVAEQLAEQNLPTPNLVAVQIGVGALAAAVIKGSHQINPDVRVLGVEPLKAGCVIASIEAGELVNVPGPHDSIMAGLNCGEPSMLAWPVVSGGTDVFVAVDDERARQAMRLLAASDIVAGETGAAGLAGILEVNDLAVEHPVREALSLGSETVLLLVITEGATDPAAYAAITGKSAW